MLRCCWLGVQQLLPQHRFYLVGNKLELIHAVRIQSKVETKAEEPLFSHLEFVSHFFGILDGRFFTRVTYAALLSLYLNTRLKLRNLLTQVV